MVDSSNGAHGSFFDPFCSASAFGFFNPKDPGTNLPPIANNVSHSPTFSLGQLGNSGIIGNGLCGLLNQQHSQQQQQQQQHSMLSMNGGLGQLTGFGQGNKSPTYNNSHSPLFGGGPSSPTGFFGNTGNTNQFSYNSNKQFPITTFSIEDTIQGRSTNDSSMYNGRSNEAPIFNRSSSFNENSSMYNRNNQTSPMFSRSSSINESSSSIYNNRSSNDSSSMFSSNRNGGNDNSAFSSMDDLNISSWNGPFSGNSSNGYGNNTTTTQNNREREPQGSFMTNTASTVVQREGIGAAGTVEGVNQGVRETGIIEKLLHSYGFIQCCERQARLFFHFSQFEGTIEHLKLGDPVEFEMTYDRRTGKPIASFVTKIGPEVVLSEERVSGNVTTELHHESNGELQGRISYENRGECFFLPYCLEDIEGNVSLATGDSVSFQIATNQRSGNLTARYVRLENPAQPVRYRGIVSSIKDNFGFIERADVAKEIFFHFSETRVHEGIVVGDNIEFNIQTRNGKEVASSISKLPFGTVIFEDIGVDVLKGQVLKPVDRSQPVALTAVPVPRSETMQGRLRYRGPDRQELEVVYGEKDQKGSFTLRHGDWVEFQLAVDRRDKQQRATNIWLLEESFVVSGERREEGVISTIKDGAGLISCAERDQKVPFNVSELIEFTRLPKLSEDVEFTMMPDPQGNRQAATRIRYLPPGTVQFEISLSKNVPGVVVREPSTTWVSQEALAGIIPSLATLGLPANVTERLIQSLSNTSNELVRHISASAPESGEPGVISYQLNGINGWQEETIIFHWKGCKQLQDIRIGTKVMFDIHQVRRTREIIAANIRCNNQEKFGDSGDEMSFNNSQQNPNQSSVGEVVEQLPVRQAAESGRGASGDFHSNFPPLTEAQRVITPPSSDYQSSNENPVPSISGSSESAKGSSRSSLDEFEPPQTPGRYSPDSDGKSSDSPPGNYGTKYHTNSVGEMNGSQKAPRFVMRGYIAALKDGFGFIETAAQDGEIFFHSSSLVGDFTSLDVGQEVEYVVSNKASLSGKNAADMVKPLPRGTICRPEVFPEVLQGVVVRPVRGANPDQSEYMGLIEDAQGRGYSFGITSMLNRKEVVQANEVVEFQVDAETNAVNIRALRKKLRATVEAVKGLYGFLSYELDDGKKLFFHMSEVKDSLHLNPGDEVEFVILQNPRNGKSSACSVVKLSTSYTNPPPNFPPDTEYLSRKPKNFKREYVTLERNSGEPEYPNEPVASPRFKKEYFTLERNFGEPEYPNEPVASPRFKKEYFTLERNSGEPEYPNEPVASPRFKKEYFTLERNSGEPEYPNEPVPKSRFRMSQSQPYETSAWRAPSRRTPSPLVPLLSLSLPAIPPPLPRQMPCKPISSDFPSGGETQRPERLLNRLSKLSVDESAPRLIVIRQPYGPDGTSGFHQPRLPRTPGIL